MSDAKLIITSDNKEKTILKILETRLYELFAGITDGKDNNNLYDINTVDVAKNSIIITLKAHQIRMEPPRISIKHKFPVRYTNLSMVVGLKVRAQRNASIASLKSTYYLRTTIKSF